MNKWERVLEALIGDSKTPIKPYAQLVDTSGKVRVKTGNVRVRLPVTQIAVTRAEKGLETFENFRLSNKNILRQVTLPVELDSVFTGELIQVGGSLSPVLHTMKNLKRDASFLFNNRAFSFDIIRHSFDKGSCNLLIRSLKLLRVSVKLKIILVEFLCLRQGMNYGSCL